MSILNKFKYLVIAVIIALASLLVAFLCVNIASANSDTSNWETLDNAVESANSEDSVSAENVTRELRADCGVVLDFRKSCWWKTLFTEDVQVSVEYDNPLHEDVSNFDLKVYTGWSLDNEFHLDLYYDIDYDTYHWWHDNSCIFIKSFEKISDNGWNTGDVLKLNVFVDKHYDKYNMPVDAHDYIVWIRTSCNEIEYADTPFWTFVPYFTRSIYVPVEKSLWGDEYFANFNINNSDFGDVALGDKEVTDDNLLVLPMGSTILYHKDNDCSSYIEFGNTDRTRWHPIGRINISSPSMDSVKIDNDELPTDNHIYIYKDFTFNIAFGKTHLTLTNENPEYGTVFYDDIELNDFDGFIHKMQFDYQIQDLDNGSKKIMVSYKCPDIKNKTIICQADETCYVNKIVINGVEENCGVIKDENIDIKVYYTASQASTILKCKNKNTDFGNVYYGDDVIDNTSFEHPCKAKDYLILPSEGDAWKIIIDFDYTKNVEIIVAPVEGGSIKDINVHISSSEFDNNNWVYIDVSFNWTHFDFKNNNPEYGHITYNDQDLDDGTIDYVGKVINYDIVPCEGASKKIVFNFDKTFSKEVFVTPIEGGSINDLQVNFLPVSRVDSCTKVVVTVSFNWTHVDFENKYPECGNILYEGQNLDNVGFDMPGLVTNYEIISDESASKIVKFDFDYAPDREVLVAPKDGGSIKDLQVVITNIPAENGHTCYSKVSLMVVFSATYLDFVNRNPEYGNIVYNEEYLDNENFISPGKIVYYEIKFVDIWTKQINFYFEEGYSKSIKVEPKNGCNITHLIVNNTTNIEGWIPGNEVNVEVGFDNNLTKINFRNKTPEFGYFVFEGQQYGDKDEIFLPGKPSSYKMPHSETPEMHIYINFDYANDRVIDVVPVAEGAIEDITVNNSSAGYGELSGQEITIEVAFKKSSLRLHNQTPNFGKVIYKDNVYERFEGNIPGKAIHYDIVSLSDNSKKLVIEREGSPDAEILFVPIENGHVSDLTVNNSSDLSGDISSSELFVMVYFEHTTLCFKNNNPNFGSIEFENQTFDDENRDIPGKATYYTVSSVNESWKKITIEFADLSEKEVIVKPCVDGHITNIKINGESKFRDYITTDEVIIEANFDSTSFNVVNSNPELGIIQFDGNQTDNLSIEVPGRAFNYTIIDKEDGKKLITFDFAFLPSREVVVVPKFWFSIPQIKINGSDNPGGNIEGNNVDIEVSFSEVDSEFGSIENKDNLVNLHYYGSCDEMPEFDLDVDGIEGNQLYKSCNYVIRQNHTWQGICYTISFYAPDVDVQNAITSRNAVPIAQKEIIPSKIVGVTGMDCLGFTADAGCFSDYVNANGEICSHDSEANVIGTVADSGNIQLKFGRVAFMAEKNNLNNKFFNLNEDKQDTHKSSDEDIEYEVKKIGIHSLIVKK